MLMPAITESPTHFRVQYHRPGGGFRSYITVALTTFCHFWPAVLTANTPKRWLPAARLMAMLSCLVEVAVYLFTPSTHSSIRAIVPVTVEAACTSTGELTTGPMRGEQMWT